MQALRGHWQLLALSVVIFALWQTPVVLPLKILVVFLHELSHAIVGILTGGSVVEIGLSPDQGGHVLIRGGSRFWSLTAGYLGSLLIGVGLLLVALRTRMDRVVLGALGAVMLLVTLLYVRGWFAFGFAGATGAALLATARFLPRNVSDLALRVIGLSSLIYVPYDILSDTILRAELRSDARMLAEEIGGTTMMWGGVWFVVSLLVIWACLRHGLGADSNLHFGRNKRP